MSQLPNRESQSVKDLQPLLANERRVVRAIFLSEPASREKIATIANLGAAGISKILKKLIDLGLVSQGKRRSATSGRPTYEYRLKSRIGYACGVSVGLDSFRLVVTL